MSNTIHAPTRQTLVDLARSVAYEAADLLDVLTAPGCADDLHDARNFAEEAACYFRMPLHSFVWDDVGAGLRLVGHARRAIGKARDTAARIAAEDAAFAAAGVVDVPGLTDCDRKHLRTLLTAGEPVDACYLR